MKALISIVAFTLSMPPLAARAADLTITVGPKDRLFRAFDRAAEHLAQCGHCKVTIKIAGGEQTGRAQVGQWTFPETIAPEGSLEILGGFDESFAKREPFAHPTILVTPERRTGPVLAFEGKKTTLEAVVISGLWIDVSAGNRYDARTGALSKGASSSWPVLAFGSLGVRELVIADNVFANAANGVGDPNVRAREATTVVVRNNVFANNVHCWQVSGLPSTPVVARYSIIGNTFLSNFPYNPDTGTSNPGALEIGNKYAAAQIEIRGNLFAHNSGGAIFPQWDDRRGPPLTISGNLFFDNAKLFGKEGGKGAVVGKFNGAGQHAVYAPEELEDDFSWTVKDNVALDPQIAFAAAAAKEAASESGDEERGGDEGEETTEVVRNEAIDSFARRLVLRAGELPRPREKKAERYGASADRVE